MMEYALQPEVPITLEILHLVFSAFGTVYKIATFEKQAGLQALVQFGDTGTAEKVFSCLSSCQRGERNLVFCAFYDSM